MRGSVATWRIYVERFPAVVSNPLSSEIFSRALTLFVLLKLWWQWPIRLLVHDFHQLWVARGSFTSPLLLPAQWATAHPNAFTLGASALLLIHLFSKRNFFTAWLFSWLVFNVFVMNRPTGDGGDLVAFTLSVWAMFLVPPRSSAGIRRLLHTTIYNLARIGCMLQFVFLYAASGVDKLYSRVWTTGVAFESMREVGGIINPVFPQMLSTPFWDLLFTWATIALELLFGVLIWFRSWQPAMIMLALMFHLGIWWMLNLPDFGMVMIVALLIFIRDDQYLKFFRPWLLST